MSQHQLFVKKVFAYRDEKKHFSSLNLNSSAKEGSASIGNLVWDDANKNGIQDLNEKGISGVKVYLLNVATSSSLSTLTDANGNYQFIDLEPGEYALVFNKPAGYEAATPNNGDDLKDSDADILGGTTYITTLEAGENDTSWDAGFYKPTVAPQPSSLKGIAWQDMNANGQKEETDLPIISLNVELLDDLKQAAKDINGNLIKATITDATGKYQFSNLKAGVYYIKFSNTIGFQSTLQNQGNDATDSDINLSTGLSAEIILTENDNNQTIDAGFYKPASIGNFVWDDLNANGVQDLFDEKGIANVNISLNGIAGNGETVSKTTSSDAVGQFKFDNLIPGKYTLNFTNLTGYKITLQASNNADFDSDINPATGQTAELTLLSGENNIGVDAGFIKTASIGDFVWEDKNKNGYQDQSEQGISNVVLTLEGISGGGKAISKRTETNSQGKYEFLDIEPGTYTITFEKPLAYKFTAKDLAINDNIDSDVDSLTYKSPAFTISSGQNKTSIDAGLYKQAIINGQVWNDINENGIQEIGETALPNIAINISGNTGDSRAFAKATTTDREGKYIFYQIDPGFYNLNFVRPTAFKTSPKDIGNDDTKDSDILNDGIAEIMVESGVSKKVDAGFYMPIEYGSIRGLVFNDLNKNGLNDDASYVYQTQVILLDSLGSKLAETKTDFNGKYVFEKLISAKYQVQFVAPFAKKFTGSNLGLKDTIDSDAAANGKTATVIIDTKLPLNDIARDIQFIDAGIIPLELVCQPICVPFIVLKK